MLRMKKALLALLALLLIAAVAFGVRTYGERDRADTVSSEDAARVINDDDDDDDDDEPTQADIEAGDRPEAGTYTYTGSGSDHVTTLGGSSHTFPDEIPAVVELDDENACEWTMNLVYVEQHIEARDYCTENDQLIDRGFERTTEFFGQTQETEYDCGADAIRMRADAAPRDSWTWECTGDDGATTSTYTLTFNGTEPVEIDGEQVDAWHATIRSEQTGDTRGGDTTNVWYDETGLMLRFSTDLDVQTKSVLGDTNYREKTSYTLTSLTPEAP